MQIGDYEVLSTVGQGGMGTVLRARHPKRGEVAIKCLMSPKQDRVRRFKRERKLLGKLGAMPGFVPILDWGESQLGPFFVMPYLAGGSLKDRLEAKRWLRVDDSVELVRALAEAMGRAHARGIIHRDLKPDNVLFDEDGSPLIADLGLAKFFTDARSRISQTQGRLSSTGDARGTWGYMAPEQIRDAKSVGPRADVFALGSILHECLTGEPAFPGNHSMEVLARITQGTFPALDGAARVPPWLRELVHQCLAFDAAQRPADGASLATALSRSSGSARRRNRWRNRRIAAYVGVALGVATALVFGEDLLALLRERKDTSSTVTPDDGAPPRALRVERLRPAGD